MLHGKKHASVMLFAQIVTSNALMRESKRMLVDDNFLSDNEILDITNRVIIHSSDIPWTLAYQTDVPNGSASIESDNMHVSYQFAAGLYPGMAAYDYFVQVFNRFAAKHNVTYNNIIRIKLNWLPRAQENASGKWHMPHVDSDQEHHVFLYYVNDSDGDTFFFNEKYPMLKDSGLTLNKQVSPKAGRGVIFDGFTYHASSSPVDSEYRCILNVDFN